MGTTASRYRVEPMVPTVPMEEPSTQVSSILRPIARYTVSIQTTITRSEEGRRLKQRHRKEAREYIKDIDLWTFYLVHTMNHAFEEELGGELSTDIPVRDVETEFYRIYDDETTETYSLTLSWTSGQCDIAFLKQAIDWQIGDRMSLYEMDGPWTMFLSPGTVTMDPLTPPAKASTKISKN